MLTQTLPPSFPAEYCVTELDALQYSRGCMVGTGIMIGGYALAVWQVLPLWGLPLLVLLVLPRWMINVHELLHIYDEQQLNPFICLMGASPVPLSILSLSYGQIRRQHFAHHAAPTTAADPDGYRIHGHWLQALWNALTSPEQSAGRWIAQHGLSGSLVFDLAVKLGLLVGLAWWDRGAFVVFWLSIRLVYGLGDFAFFRLVHHQRGEAGTFGLTLPPLLMTLSEWVFGQTVTHATLNHDIHHRNPYIAARSLMAARSLTAHSDGDSVHDCRA